MNKKQRNQLSMKKTVESFLKDKEIKYSDMEELKELRLSLKNKIEEIIQKDEERQNVAKGTATVKSSARTAIIESAVAVAGKVFAYAKKVNDLTLIEKTNITRTTLSKLRMVELPIAITTIIELAAENLPAMSGYGLTDVKVTALRTKLNEFISASETKDTSGAVKSGTYVSLNQLFSRSEEMIASIDKLMEEYKTNDLEFYAGYRSARVIKDLGSKHSADEEPEAPVQLQGENMNKAV